MNDDTCEYCDGTGTFGPLVTFDKILEIERGKLAFKTFNQEWIRLSKNESIFKRRCPKCFGDGHLDWVERIVGKRFENVRSKEM